VIEGFMAQGGDPSGTGTGGSELPDLPAEFSEPSRARFLRGVCGMARTSNPDSANSQFFIMFAPIPSLDGQYTIWGEVTAGMEAVDKIKRGSGGSGMVQGPDRIRSMKVAVDNA
jgi:cyclophilin family peptidyl-prolyl cis-trans isomerase